METVRVYWPADKMWYPGSASRAALAHGGRLVVNYFDGEREELEAAGEQIMAQRELVWGKMKGTPWWPCQAWEHVAGPLKGRQMIEFLGEKKMANRGHTRTRPWGFRAADPTWQELSQQIDRPDGGLWAGFLLQALQQAGEALGLQTADRTDRSRRPGGPKPLGCKLCADASQDHKLLLCDGCNAGFHTFCLQPPLKSVPVGDWLCSQCRAVRRRARDDPVRARGGFRPVAPAVELASWERGECYLRRVDRWLEWGRLDYDAESEDTDWCRAERVELGLFERIVDLLEKCALALGRLSPPSQQELELLGCNASRAELWQVYAYWLGKRASRAGAGLLRLATSRHADQLRRTAPFELGELIEQQPELESQPESESDQCPHCGLPESCFQSGAPGLFRHVVQCPHRPGANGPTKKSRWSKYQSRMVKPGGGQAKRQRIGPDETD